MTSNAPPPPEPGFDAEAARIARYAYVSALDESAGATHLLRMLSCPGTGFAVRARKLGLQPDLQGIAAAEGDVPLTTILRSATELAERMGSRSTGPHHLYVAAVDAAGGALRERLDAQGLTPERVRQVLSSSPECLPAERRPGSITGIALVMMLNALGCGGVGLVMMTGAGFYSGYGGRSDQAAGLAWAIWCTFTCFILGVGLLERARWAWGGAVGFLTLHALSVVILLVPTRGAPAVLLMLLVYAAMTTELVRKASWFGVPPRRFMRTLWKSGAWAIVPTLVLQLALLLTARMG